VRACSRCGTVADDDVPAGWSTDATERGIQWICDRCTRDNVRSIEAKLPEEWWT